MNIVERWNGIQNLDVFKQAVRRGQNALPQFPERLRCLQSLVLREGFRIGKDLNGKVQCFCLVFCSSCNASDGQSCSHLFVILGGRHSTHVKVRVRGAPAKQSKKCGFLWSSCGIFSCCPLASFLFKMESGVIELSSGGVQQLHCADEAGGIAGAKWCWWQIVR